MVRDRTSRRPCTAARTPFGLRNPSTNPCHLPRQRMPMRTSSTGLWTMPWLALRHRAPRSIGIHPPLEHFACAPSTITIVAILGRYRSVWSGEFLNDFICHCDRGREDRVAVLQVHRLSRKHLHLLDASHL